MSYYRVLSSKALQVSSFLDLSVYVGEEIIVMSIEHAIFANLYRHQIDGTITRWHMEKTCRHF